MRRILLLLLVSVLFLPALASAKEEVQQAAPPPPPEIEKTLAAYEGDWTYQCTMGPVGAEKPEQFEMKMTCKRGEGVTALSCSGGAKNSEGPFNFIGMVGWDMFDKKVKFMIMSSDQEYHAHSCDWKDEKNVVCESYKGGWGPKAITEDLSFMFDGDKSDFVSVYTMEDGSKLQFTGKGTRKK